MLSKIGIENAVPCMVANFFNLGLCMPLGIIFDGIPLTMQRTLITLCLGDLYRILSQAHLSLQFQQYLFVLLLSRKMRLV